MLLPIAQPLADDTTAKRILKEVIKKGDKLISGMKPCMSYIKEQQESKSDTKFILVLNGTAQPMDLVTHIPAFCEEEGIPYIWVEKGETIAEKTCVMINGIEEEKYEKILKETKH